MFKINVLKTVGLLFSTAFLVSCGNKSGPSKVRINLPNQLESQKLNPSIGTLPLVSQMPNALSDIWSPAFAPLSTAELNCFGVAVGGPADVESLQGKKCLKTDGGEIEFGVQFMGGAPGTRVDLEVEAGEDRVIHVLGWKTENPAACETLKEGLAVEAKQLSHPFIIASETRDLAPGIENITITASLTGAQELVNCDIFQPKLGSLSTRTFTLGGTVTGNKVEGAPGANLKLLVNGSGAGEEVTGDTFALSDVIGDGVEYIVSISQQPAGKTCEISNNTGTIDGDNITDISVTCEDIPLTVGGTIIGLDNFEGRNLILGFNSGGEEEGETEFLERTENGAFQFENTVLHNSPFNVFVSQQPIGETCLVSNGSGTTNGVNITNVVINCSTNKFPVGGTVTGLLAERSFTIENRRYTEEEGQGELLVINQNGGFVFLEGVEFNDNYTVSVAVQPPGMNCTVANAAGVMGEGDVTNVNITCVPLLFTVGGTISGMVANRAIDLSLSFNEQSLSDSFIENGSFEFVQEKVPSGTSYSAAITTLPIGHACSISNVIGVPFDSDITNIVVDCVPKSFNVGGQLNGLIAGRSVTIQNNGGDDIVLNSNDSFTFATKVLTGQNHNVTVSVQPPGQNCTVSNSGLEVLGNNVNNISVDCVPLPFNVGGNVTGIALGQQVEIEVVPSQGEEFVATVGNGVYSVGPILSALTFTASVSEDAFGHDCSLSNGSGLVFDQDITNVDVVCTPQTFEVGGSLTGLIAGRSITLQNNEGDDITLTADGSFNFETEIAFGSDYAATILTQPPGQTCTVANASGTISDVAVINDIAVTCVPDNFDISVTVSGLIVGRSFTLQNNAGNDLVINSVGGPFTFTQQVASGQNYNVAVSEQAPGMTCTVSNASGTVFDSAITDVQIDCTPLNFTLGGNVTGHPGVGSLILSKDFNQVSVLADGPFTFGATIPSGQPFNIVVSANPPNFTCTVSGGSGVIFDQNVTTPVVTCIENTFSVGGTVTGLADGETLVIDRSEAETLNIVGDGNSTQTYQFVNELTNGTGYGVFIVSQPSGQTCTLENENGTVAGADVTNIDITCTDNPPIAIGQLDTTFNGSGGLTFDSGENDALPQVELDSQERPNVTFQSLAAAPEVFACRMLSDGSNDPSFGGCGLIGSIANLTDIVPSALVVDSSDRMIIGGNIATSNMFVARLTSTGLAVDTTFNGGGLAGVTAVTNSCGTSGPDQALSLFLDSGSPENIFAAGFSAVAAGDEAHAWWKFNGTGALVGGFANNGVLPGISCASETTTNPEKIAETIIDSQGRLLSVGSVTGAVSGNLDFKLVRLNATTGQPDATFGTAGVVVFDVGLVDTPKSIVEDSQGRIYVAGQGNGQLDGVIVRFLSDGTLDSTYGVGGVVTFNPNGAGPNAEIINKIVLDAGENIIAVGEDTSNDEGFVARFTTAGVLDTSFAASQGFITFADNQFKDAAVDSQGKIYVIATTSGGATVTVSIRKIE